MISTGFKSVALIALENSTLTVRPLTRLSLEELQSAQGNESVSLRLQTGRVRADVNPPAGGKTSFSVHSPVATASVRGTAFDFDGTNLSVDDGQVYVAGKDGVGVYVGAGHESVSNPETGRTAGPAELLRAELTFAPPAGGGSVGPKPVRSVSSAGSAGSVISVRPVAKEGPVTIQLSAGSDWAKAVFTPEVISGLRNELEFRNSDGQVINRSIPQGKRNMRLTLPQGKWTVTARAYDSINALQAAGRATVTVKQWRATVSVPLRASNANLSGLTVSAGLLSITPAFSPNQTSYAMSGILAFSSTVNISATASDPSATITINGEAVNSGATKTVSDLSMFGGTVTIQVVVTAQDRVTSKTYTVTANRNLF
jgi:hypothetical protein